MTSSVAGAFSGPSPAATPSPVKVDNIQYLRAIAALIVVGSHTLLNLDKTLGVELPSLLPGPFGVEVFFIISGFIITHTSLRRFGNAKGALAFANHRFWRVAPLYWFVTTLYLIISLLAPTLIYKGYSSVPHTVASYLFFPWLQMNGSMDPIYVAGWSLNFEMFFYLTFSLVMWLPWRIGLTVATVFLVGLVLIHPIFPPNTPLSVWSRPFVLEFLIGMGLAIAARRVSFRLPFAALWPLLAVLLAAASILFHVRPQTQFASAPTIALATMLVASGVFCRAASKSNTGLKALNAVGDASYSLYLVHMFAVRFCIKGLQISHLLGRMPWGISGLLCMICAIVLALLSYRYLEQGLFPALRRRIEGHTPAPSVSPA